MARRTIAVAAGLLVLILIVLGIRGCLNERQERALMDYSSSSASLVRESNQQGDALFDLLQGAGGPTDAVEAENSLNGLRVQAAQLVDRARDLDVPDEMDQAQRYLLDTLELRSDGLAAVANSLPRALSDQDRREGSDRVVEQMQVFLASDVFYTARFKPSLQLALKEEDLAAQSLPEGGFVPDIEWLQPAFVADAIEGIRSGTSTGGDTAPGLHGNGLVAVSLGGVALTPGASATVSLSDDLAFDVQVANQGEHTESDVNVRVKVGAGGDATTLEEAIATIAAGETKSVTLPLSARPPTGQSVPIEVTVEPVPGEEKTDNNSQSFSVIFTS